MFRKYLRGKKQKYIAISRLKHIHRPQKLSAFGIEKYNQEIADQTLLSGFSSELDCTLGRTDRTHLEE